MLFVQVQHHVAKDRSCARDAAHVLHGRVVKIARPHADGVLRRVAHRPVVAKGGAGAGLHRAAEGQADHRPAAKGHLARLIVAEDVGDQPALALAQQAALLGGGGVLQQRPRLEAAQSRQTRIRIRQLDQPHGGIANREAQAVVRGVFIQCGQAQLAQPGQQRLRTADGVQHAHGGDVQRIPQRLAVGHGAVAAQGVVLRAVGAGGSGKLHRQIRHEAGRRGPALKGQQIRKRLHGRARRVRSPRAIELAAVFGKEVARARQREHRARGVVDDHHGGMRHMAALQRLQPLGDDRLDVLLQRGIQRGTHGAILCSTTQHLHRVRGLKAAAEALQHDLLVQRHAVLLIAQPVQRMHLVQDVALARQHTGQVAEGIQPCRRLRQRGQQRALRRREIAQRLVEIARGSCGGTGHEIAKGNAVRIRRQHRLTAPRQGQPSRTQRLSDLDPQRAPAVLRRGVFDELLMDRRGPGDDVAAAHIAPRSARDGQQIDTTVGEEALVLRRQQSMHQRRRDLRVAHGRGRARAVFV